MRILRSIQCEAELLGDRRYLHSTTIVRSLVNACRDTFAVGDVQQLSAQFHALTDRECEFDQIEQQDKAALIQRGYVATFKLSGSHGDAIIGLRPTERPIVKHAPFDEDALAEGCQIDVEQQQIVLLMLQKESLHKELLPTVVALNKRLHSALFANAGFGKWLLTRLDLTQGYFQAEAPRQLCLQVIAVLASVNTKVAILSDGDNLGSVHFSRKKETT